MVDHSYYWSSAKCHRANVPFNFILGGRGTGKTYGGLTEAFTDYYGKFLYARRTDVEISSISNPKFNPFKKLNTDKGWNVQAEYTGKGNYGTFYQVFDEETGDKEFCGYAAAISTFANLRGADLSDVDLMVYDEFIKAKTKKVIPDEAGAFFNTYETINRNRELEGLPALKVYLFSNSTSLDNPILYEMHLIPVIEEMKRKRQYAWTNREIGVHIELLDDSKISQAKKDTALYRATKGTTFAAHALDNEFAYDSFEGITKVDLRYYKPWIQVGDIILYTNETGTKYHACKVAAKCPYTYKGDGEPLFRRLWGVKLYNLIHGGFMTYDCFETKNTLWSYFSH